MIVKQRKNKQLSYLEALQGRTTLTDAQQLRLEQLRLDATMELQFESLIAELETEDLDLIWQFHYSDYHHDALIHLVLISSVGIHLFKLNHYAGLHYVNNQGMLADYFTDEVKVDLAQLNCVKYSIHQILSPNYKHLPIYTKAVCLNPKFELDVHTHRGQFLMLEDVPDYVTKINHTLKKKQFRSPNC